MDLGRVQKAHLFDLGLGSRVITAREVGRVFLSKGLSADWVSIIIMIDASCSENSAVDSLEEAAVCEI